MCVGLTPLPRELDEFTELAEKDLPAALEELVECLLASDYFGAIWLRQWLGGARYADSNGYKKDLRSEQWTWRGWVIVSINNDMQYERFIMEQVADGLVNNPLQWQQIGPMSSFDS